MRPRQDPVGRPIPRLGPLPPSVLARPTRDVARALLGTWISTGRGGARRLARIVETEAYVAHDPANHAYRGPTPRNRAMFGPPGRWYVYRIHQVHCANVVTGPGEAVLLRAADPWSRGLGSLSGPGRLARGFGIDRRDDGSSVRTGRVRLLAGPRPSERVVSGRRVGVSRAVERRLRFYLDDVPEVSRPRASRAGRRV